MKPGNVFATRNASVRSQLTPIEKYAMRVVESSDTASAAERAALDDMRRQLRDWEDKRRRLRESPPPAPAPRAASPQLTFGREDARAQVRARRRRAPRPPLRAPPPSPPPSPPAAVRTRSRGTVHINLWSLDAGRRRALRNGTLDSWLTSAPRRPDIDNK